MLNSIPRKKSSSLERERMSEDQMSSTERPWYRFFNTISFPSLLNQISYR